MRNESVITCLNCHYRRDASAVNEAVALSSDAYVASHCPRCGTPWGSNEPERLQRTSAVVVREYRDRRDFEWHARDMAADGYSVTSVIEQQQNSGLLRILTLGLYSLIVRPDPRLLVTYQRRLPGP